MRLQNEITDVNGHLNLIDMRLIFYTSLYYTQHVYLGHTHLLFPLLLCLPCPVPPFVPTTAPQRGQ